MQHVSKAVVTRDRPDSKESSSKPSEQPHLWPMGRALAIAFTTAVIVMGASWFALYWLIGFPDRTPAKPLDTRAQLDLLKLAFAVVAGIGGVVALVTAYRRQRITERSQEHAERVAEDAAHDAAERRITELYAKAADQLGSDKAPVRLAGLYALERLAQDNPSHRQTIVDVICSYLRMPYEPPTKRQPVEAPRASLPTGTTNRPDSATSADIASREELLVRKAAQEIIGKHLHTHASDTGWPRQSVPSDPDFWPGIRLNLDGATLVDFEFTGGRVEIANFSGTRFIGGANFAHADFEGHVFFAEARFEAGPGHFLGAWFGLRVVFDSTRFGEHQASFEGSTFAGMASFRGAIFEGGVTFDDARALDGFDTNWGSQRSWPSGWSERQIAAGEKMPRPRLGRWAGDDSKPPKNRWKFIIRGSDDSPS